ncbi:hypothetical protein DNTS_013498 [Danionella cerebrum]|uniref:B30.2/SPRY domain-containing protein n=1 Tax=Danionella cerebrum TaxID=2873325 RepID=A0A553RN18_9TELE|nr:hypothetical protein DNTS_013498 [Danionella translucida]
MSTESRLCELATVSLHVCDPMSDHGTGRRINGSEGGQLLFNNGNSNEQCPTNSALKLMDREESGIAGSSWNSGTVKQCQEHECELNFYCNTEEKLTCSRCVSGGSCQGHANQLVDICEKMQLQSLRIERFIDQTLTAREKAAQNHANNARERVLAQTKVVREALEEEEQRLLEAIQKEEERVEQCLLTQRAHWTQTLEKLSHTRNRLVHTLTHSTDALLVSSNEEINDRVEEAEGAGEPRDSEQLSLNKSCTDSKLLVALWASAALLGPSSHSSGILLFDQQTISPLLSLSTDQRTLTFHTKRQQHSPSSNPERFDWFPNALCLPPMSSGMHSWVVDVGTSGAFKIGVSYASIGRKGSGNDVRLGYNSKSWVLSHYDGELSFCHDGCSQKITVTKKLRRVGVLLDWAGQTLLFFDQDSLCVLHAVKCVFREPLLAACAVSDQSISILN